MRGKSYFNLILLIFPPFFYPLALSVYKIEEKEKENQRKMCFSLKNCFRLRRTSTVGYKCTANSKYLLNICTQYANILVQPAKHLDLMYFFIRGLTGERYLMDFFIFFYFIQGESQKNINQTSTNRHFRKRFYNYNKYMKILFYAKEFVLI